MSKDKYSRRPLGLLLRNKVLIMCSGETEEIYFSHFKNTYKRDLQNISIKVLSYKKSNPMAVAKAALAQKNDYEEVWAVFDKVEFNKKIERQGLVLLVILGGLRYH